MIRYFVRFLLLGFTFSLLFSLASCNDHLDWIDYEPYPGPIGTPGPPAGPDDDHCDGC